MRAKTVAGWAGEAAGGQGPWGAGDRSPALVLLLLCLLAKPKPVGQVEGARSRGPVSEPRHDLPPRGSMPPISSRPLPGGDGPMSERPSPIRRRERRAARGLRVWCWVGVADARGDGDAGRRARHRPGLRRDDDERLPIRPDNGGGATGPEQRSVALVLHRRLDVVAHCAKLLLPGRQGVYPAGPGSQVETRRR